MKNQFVLITGPCVIESKELLVEVARVIKPIALDLDMKFVLKGSFKKANRTSVNSFTGIGDEIALRYLNEVGKDFEVETLPGVFLGQKNVPIESTGAYIPGGKYPLLASAHMTIVTAKVAGVKRVVACTPLIKGEMPDATIAAMKLAGADEIYILGGIQAIAAMAIGTETIAPVAMIAGPGNAFVAEAKRQLFGEVGIDLFAGPTEILIVADESADPFIVAVDLLSQAEHGPDSPAILITTDESLGHQVSKYVDEILIDMPTKDYAEPAWRDWGAIHVVANIEDAFALADEYASEHVQILTANPRQALEKMNNYGALFLGEGTCVSYGDKVIGTGRILLIKNEELRKASR